MKTYVEKGSIVNTDDFPIYTKEIKRKGYKHRIIPHNKKKFAEGNVHINNAENRFSFLKSWYRVFRGISKKYLSLWISFFEFLLNLKTNLIGKTVAFIRDKSDMVYRLNPGCWDKKSLCEFLQVSIRSYTIN